MLSVPACSWNSSKHVRWWPLFSVLCRHLAEHYKLDHSTWSHHKEVRATEVIVRVDVGQSLMHQDVTLCYFGPWGLRCSFWCWSSSSCCCGTLFFYVSLIYWNSVGDRLIDNIRTVHGNVEKVALSETAVLSIKRLDFCVLRCLPKANDFTQTWNPQAERRWIFPRSDFLFGSITRIQKGRRTNVVAYHAVKIFL